MRQKLLFPVWACRLSSFHSRLFLSYTNPRHRLFYKMIIWEFIPTIWKQHWSTTLRFLKQFSSPRTSIHHKQFSKSEKIAKPLPKFHNFGTKWTTHLFQWKLTQKLGAFLFFKFCFLEGGLLITKMESSWTTNTERIFERKSEFAILANMLT